MKTTIKFQKSIATAIAGIAFFAFSNVAQAVTPVWQGGTGTNCYTIVQRSTIVCSGGSCSGGTCTGHCATFTMTNNGTCTINTFSIQGPGGICFEVCGWGKDLG